MSDVWRVFVVDGDEALNQSIVNSLHKDGYDVRGALNGADAVRVLWSDEYDVVICDLKTPGADSFELLQWLRAYRPNTRMIMVGAAGEPALRVQALESGALGYLEKPLDMRALKDELRRLQQQSGFTASLDSFDLLDVIQIINMSRKTITLLINTGLEERGALRFQNGELIWADYGILHGEEAFFALAAHKNGTVTEQYWNDPVTANVTQPLSRLIFQALQYRSKYADRYQYTGEMVPVKSQPQQPVTDSSPKLGFSLDEVDDSPFIFQTDEAASSPDVARADELSQPTARMTALGKQMVGEAGANEREWWERTGQINSLQVQKDGLKRDATSSFALESLASGVDKSEPVPEMPYISEAPVELPAWLIDQPSSGMSRVPPRSPQPGAVPATPRLNTSSAEWQAQPSALSQPSQPLASFERTVHSARPSSSPNWETVRPPHSPSYPAMPPSGPLQRPGSEQGAARLGQVGQEKVGEERVDALQDSNPMLSTATLRAQRLAARRNYAALVSALQTLGYSITGFIAAAVVNIEGQPVAQVAIDDLDISKLCRYFSMIQKSVLQALEQEPQAGEYEEAVVTSNGRHILMRAVGTDRKAFLVLMTTREANPTESLEVMANVEGAISAALR